MDRKSPVALLRRSVSGYLFLLPALVLFALFAWWPIINGLLLSFRELDLIRYTQPDYRPEWIGFGNFESIIGDPLLQTAWLNTFRFMALALLLGYLVPVLLAISVNEVRRGKGYFRLAFYLPVILPPMISILLWKYFYDPGSGIMNVLVTFFGGDPLQWIYSADTSMLSLVILWTWTTAGSTMLLYLAALQGIPASLYESAEIEGASVWQRLFHITLPEIRGVMIILLVLQIIGTMQIFTEPFVMTDGGPVNSTLTVMVLLYRYAFERGEIGWATALGLLIFVVLVAFSLLYLFVTRKFRGAAR
ncbi:MAG: carbohydrate ABC transporter permease [Spirochaetales bacterium]